MDGDEDKEGVVDPGESPRLHRCGHRHVFNTSAYRRSRLTF